jgi:hypothetical protein
VRAAKCIHDTRKFKAFEIPERHRHLRPVRRVECFFVGFQQIRELQHLRLLDFASVYHPVKQSVENSLRALFEDPCHLRFGVVGARHRVGVLLRYWRTFSEFLFVTSCFSSRLRAPPGTRQTKFAPAVPSCG